MHKRETIMGKLYGRRPLDQAARSFANLLFMAGVPDQATYDDTQATTLALLAIDLGAADVALVEAEVAEPAFVMTDEGRAAHRALAAMLA
jgi:hypothetical protein